MTAWLLAAALAAPGPGGPAIAASFQLPGLPGSPFDVTANDVRVVLVGPTGAEWTVPAFYDGGETWRVRANPRPAGRWTVARVLRNGAAVTTASVVPAEFVVTASPGVVKLAGSGFAHADGTPYLPLGCNVGWGSRGLDVPGHLAKLGAAGCTWSRIWMCHWDGKNLDWVPGRKLPPGDLSLEVARKWDGIVAAAEQAGICFQLTLQHHGQYSTRTNPNWAENPWNVANGGWLARANDFFTDPRAVALTRAKYRYIVARWGYSPAVLAWELFNEVQYVDAVHDQQADAVGQWHRQMAAWLREQDVHHHLVTTSSDLSLPIHDAVDYLQPHAYVADPLATLSLMEGRHDAKPLFVGEIGPNGPLDRDDGTWLHRAVWGGLMSLLAGPPQYWAWDTVEHNQLYPVLAAATGFVQASGLAAPGDWRRLPATVATDRLGPLSFGPGSGWSKAPAAPYVVGADGSVSGLGAMPAFLQGNWHRADFPEAVFTLDLPQPATFSVRFNQVSNGGGKAVLKVDGTTLKEQVFAGGKGDRSVDETVTVPVPAGRHSVTLRNDGQDWLVIGGFTIDPCVPALAVLGKQAGRRAVLWLENRQPAQPVAGTLSLSGLSAGHWTLHWWNPQTGQPAGAQPLEVTAGQPAQVVLPPVAKDLAAWLTLP